MTTPGRPFQLLLIGALALAAMVSASTRSWVCDDAFITFRYAENIANGLGAVYNAGERVEGYSNPSWMVLCALAIRLGLDPVPFGQWLGIVCFGALVVATWWAGRRLLPGDGSFLPLAAVGVALHWHLGDFASCGLETLGFVLLVVLIVGVVARAQRPRTWALASFLTVLAAVTRPDGALVGAIAGLLAVVASLRQKNVGPVVGFAVPGLLLFVPFLAFRFLYYGDLLPNTFYAKSAHDPYASQGWFYVRLFFDAYWVLWPALFVLPVLLLWRRAPALPRLATIALGYLLFVVWVGGDFMFARFCLPIVPLLYLALEAVTRRFLIGALRWLALLLIAASTLLFHEREDLRVTGSAVQGVADEHAQYPEARTRAIREAGARLGQLTEGKDLRVAFSGTQAMLVYEAKVSYALEAVTGLTDAFLAHQEVAVRGQPGHEKGMFRTDEAREYVLRTQGVHLLLFEYPLWTSAFPFLKVELGGFTFTLVRWDPKVMAGLLAAPDVKATDLERYLDDYVRELDTKTKDQVAIDLVAFDMVHFRWNGDAGRRAAIVTWLGK